MTRHRSFSVVAAGALSLSLVLAACGIEPAESGGGEGGGASADPGTGSAAPSAAAVGGGEPEANLEFANWPLYIDQDDEGNSPTIQQFEESTGVDVNYTEAIEDNVSFFGTIQPALAAGDDTGYDMIVITDWMVGNMVRLGYLEPLDVERDVPDFLENADAVYLERSYDPGNVYSVPYQSGITGIAYNPALVDEEITSMAQLFDPEFIEKYCGQIGMFVDARDGLSFALLYNGVDAGRGDHRGRRGRAADPAGPGALRPRLLRQRVRPGPRRWQPGDHHGVVRRRLPAPVRQPGPRRSSCPMRAASCGPTTWPSRRAQRIRTRRSR